MIRSDYNQLALRARWLFYHFISNSGSWNNCYLIIKIKISEKRRIPKLWKKGKIWIKIQTKVDDNIIRPHGFEAFRTNFYIWCCFLCTQAPLRIEKQNKLRKFTIFTRKPRSHTRILIYRTWSIRRQKHRSKRAHSNNYSFECDWLI